MTVTYRATSIMAPQKMLVSRQKVFRFNGGAYSMSEEDEIVFISIPVVKDAITTGRLRRSGPQRSAIVNPAQGFPHNIKEMTALEGSQHGKRALIILGGPSGVKYQEIAHRTKPDIVIGANGAIRALNGNMDYWVCMESWDRSNPPCWFQDPCRGTRIVTWKRYNLLNDKSGAYSARRGGPVFAKKGGITCWNPRLYNGGLYHSENFNRPEITSGLTGTFKLGTVAIQCLHLAGMLGVSQIETVGLDLCFRGDVEHWYKEAAISHNNMWWDERMFTEYKGLQTMWWWIDSASFLLKAKERLSACGCEWTDHSDGLLSVVDI